LPCYAAELGAQGRKAKPFLRTPSNEASPRFSHDGRWLVYISVESGRYEVYVQPHPSPGGKWQISTEGGTEPVWNPSGRELFYRSGNKMVAPDGQRFLMLKPSEQADAVPTQIE
jgi:Tol biopolymer transport system component